MKLLLLILFASLAFAQSPQPANITIGSDAPPTGTCVDNPQIGNLYIRTDDPRFIPVGMFRCTQVGPRSMGAAAFSWQPIGHLNVATLPPACAVGDIAFLRSAPVGQNLYACTSANTWTAQGGINGGAYTNGTYCVAVTNGTATLTQANCPGGGTGGNVLWSSMTNTQWTSLTNTQWTSMGN